METERITISDPDGADMATADAEVYGEWAIHPQYLGHGEWATRGDWAVTWVPNGRRLASCPTKRLAAALARHVRDAGLDPTAEDRHDRWAKLRDAFCDERGVMIVTDPFRGWLMVRNPEVPHA